MQFIGVAQDNRKIYTIGFSIIEISDFRTLIGLYLRHVRERGNAVLGHGDICFIRGFCEMLISQMGEMPYHDYYKVFAEQTLQQINEIARR